jgi:hypothetical protein
VVQAIKAAARTMRPVSPETLTAAGRYPNI